MPEGLSPETAHKQVERHENSPTPRGRRAGILQVAEATVLALVTLTAAWSGFAAAKWGTESRIQLAEGSTARAEANRAFNTANTLRNFDASTFNTWFTAHLLGNKTDAAVAERRFRPVYATAFRAWIATDPEHNPKAAPGPSYMPEYVLPQEATAAKLDAKATDLSAQGAHSGIVGDQYVRITVVLAGVLFLVGIGSTFAMAGIRWALLSVGAALFIGAIVLIITTPAPPS